ncbi:MOP flippase family protein [Reichenbachiella sp. MSK19-1]|uniref:MOP flippase family protein n=1 Tax=Reichenbachiella sp. MSK19-1 TaxID=1897631 RepID=UPI000E6B8DEB|nr:MOP flippase family protein [Reichenbachiella sp. MSK19-1]RJE70858.1 hypothetical protein BGP76_08730 [Reichenbachiella sp. MSK19-1]
MTSIKSVALSGIKWTFGSQILLQLVDLIVTAILSRLLAPDDFGLFAVVFTTLNLFNSLKNMGFGSALIHKKKPSPLAITSLFWLTAGIGLVFSLTLYISSGYIGTFFNKESLPYLLRLVSVVYLIQGVSSIPSTLIQKELQFRAIFKMNTISMVLSNGVAIFAAYQGYGVLALAFKMITSSLVGLGLSWYVSRYKLSFAFNWSVLKPFFSFGWPIFLDGILGYGLRNLDNILIGKYFNASTLGYYNKSYQLMVLPMSNITKVLSRVMFPTLSKVNDDAILKRTYLKSISLVSAITFPAMFGLSVLAEEAIMIVYGDQWRPAIPYLQILCITGAFQPMASLAGNYYLIKGKTFLSLKVSVLSRLFMIGSIILGLQYGPLGIAISYTISSLIAFMPELYFTSRLVGLHFFEPIKAFSLNLLITLVMVSTVFVIKNHTIDLGDQLLIRSLSLPLIGIFTYLTLSFLFNKKIWKEYVSIFKSISHGQ